MIDQITRAQQDARKRGVLNMWTVYDHPADFPKGFIARRWEVGNGSNEPVRTSDVLQDKLHVMRACLRYAGLTPIPPQPEHDPAILEIWL